jgi:gluconate 2-dehydrogenase gamma chain
MTAPPGDMGEPLVFLNPVEAAAIDAIADRIVPADDGEPGARDARSVLYVDRMLAGFGRDLQGLYRSGLRALEQLCAERFGRRFAELSASEQDRLLAELDGRGTDDELGRLFAVAREHIVQGLFCDPVYGGNRDGVGWRLVGFPGARWGYSAEQMARDFDAATIPLTTLADLYAGDRSQA